MNKDRLWLRMRRAANGKITKTMAKKLILFALIVITITGTTVYAASQLSENTGAETPEVIDVDATPDVTQTTTVKETETTTIITTTVAPTTEATTAKPTTTSAPATTAAKTTQTTTTKKATAIGCYSSLKNVISDLSPDTDFELDKNGVPVNYSKKIVGEATAYSEHNYTASGVFAGEGYIAVNPNQFPYGTKLFIRSVDGNYTYGYCIAADTGGFVKNGRTICDLFFDTNSECIQFGRRDVEIYVLN